jgi:hypothetical protein
MDPEAGQISSKDTQTPQQPIRDLEIAPALKRDRLLARVRAARRRLPQVPPGAFARMR